MKKRVIVLVGMPGSGKEEFLKVARKKNFSIIRMGDIVREEVKKKRLKPIDKNIGMLADSERKKYGYDIWAKRTITRIKDKLTVIDGSRGDAEISIFKQKFGKALTIVGIFSSPMTRYIRMKSRRRMDQPLSLEDFQRRDQRELKWGIGNALAIVDYMIVNEGTLIEFKGNVEKIIERIIKKKK